MTSVVEFTYLYNNFSLNFNESIMTRAVRVKTTVKDKIKRIFDSKEVVVNNGNVVEQNEEKAFEKQTLIDLSQDKLINLNNIINALQTQQSVSYFANRAVLFTQPLVSKINRVTNKWFDGMPRVEKEVSVSDEIPSVDMVNHLGGEVVPGNWNKVDENEIAQEKNYTSEPTLEAVPSVEAIVPNVDDSIPNIEIPTSLGNTDVYKFDFNMDSVLPTVEPVIENKETNDVSLDFVPEPKQIDAINNDSLSSEQTAVSNENVVPSFENSEWEFSFPSFESTVNPEVQNSYEKSVDVSNVSVESTVTEFENETTHIVPGTYEMEDKINDLLSKEFIPNPANNFVPEYVDSRPAEVKIDDLLGRVNNSNIEISSDSVEETVAPVQELEPVVNVGSEAKVEIPEITQGQVLAKLRRLNNAMSEKDATIKNLTSKNTALKEEVAVSKDKISEYEAKLSDLSLKNSDLSSQNERLSTRLEEVETSSKSTILKLESKVSELTQSKSEEIESLRKQLDELKEKHSSEISSMREKHAIELKAANDSKEKQIQAIYATITDALGDTFVDDDYSKGMAA